MTDPIRDDDLVASIADAPVDAVRDEVVGPAGPTTFIRMDGFAGTILDAAGLLVTVGKAERGPAAIESIARHGAAYLMAVGGAAYLESKAVKSARVLTFADLGMRRSKNSWSPTCRSRSRWMRKARRSTRPGVGVEEAGGEKGGFGGERTIDYFRCPYRE